MDYGQLTRRSFDIAWKYKTLWILGFFAAASGSVFQLSNRLPGGRGGWLERTHPELFDKIIDWVSSAPGTIALMSLVGGLFLFALFFFIMHHISVAGLIGGVYKIERGESFRIGGLFSLGASYFWRFLGLFFIFLIIISVFVVLLLIPLVIAFSIAVPLGVILLLPLIPIFFAGIFFFGNIYSLAQRQIIAYETPVFDSISEGYHLLKKYLSANIIIFLIMTGLQIAIMIAGSIIIALGVLPFIILGVHSTYTVVILLVLVIPMFLLVMIIVEGFLGTFFNSLMTLFYLELRKLTPFTPISPMPTGPPESGI
jgi:hypothetical protein